MAEGGGLHSYQGDGFAVEYDPARCLHAGACTHGLPQVFDVKRQPWVQPGGASVEAVREAVLRCPTGALQLRERGGGLAERLPPRAVVRLAAGGPLYLEGDLELDTPLGRRRETRVALCRCGKSARKPYCDDAHVAAGFTDPGMCVPPAPGTAATGGKLAVSYADRGPLVLRGAFEVRDARGQVMYVGERAALCRCGGSMKKPFCDATHKGNGFSG